MKGNKRHKFYSIVSCVLWWSYFLNDTVNSQKATSRIAKSQSAKFFSLWPPKPTIQIHWYHLCKVTQIPFVSGQSLITVPFLFLEMISQILLLEQGSTPVVGSSRITTLDPPSRAMAMDNFLFMPPDRVPASLWRWLYSPVSFKVLQNRGKTTAKSCP